MKKHYYIIIIFLCLFTLFTSMVEASTKEVVVVTSFPKELFETYKKAFEAKYSGVTVIVKQKQTTEGVTYIRETASKPEADIMWASAVDAFQLLKTEKLLTQYPLPKEIGSKIPAKVGTFPIHDPDGFYFGFALSGYGMMWNKPYLQTHKLKSPKEWTDLINPNYYGHLAISAPSRSGTTHLTVEAILQAYGWEKGWALLLNMGGNMAAVTERSFGVPEGVNNGQYGIGIVIDFFGLSAIASGFPVDFAYPSMMPIVPANAGLVKNGPNQENAKNLFIIGSNLILNIRPESIQIFYPNEILPDGNRIEGTIKTSAYLGSLVQYEVEVTGGKRVKVNVVNPRRKALFQEGEQVSLAFSSEDIVSIPLKR